MNPDDLSDDQLDDLASKLAPRLPTGSHGDRVITTRRQFAAAVSGVLGVGGLMALGVDEAAAQAAGQQGTESSPNTMYAYDLYVQNTLQTDLDAGGNAVTNLGALNGGGPLSDGDGTERQLWIIANGAGDPNGADSEDIILEEEA